MNDLLHCTICPRKCGINRISGTEGYCRSNAGFNIGSICIHRGEEPVISGNSGICNIFFTGCNLQCVYCQNYQISHSKNRYSRSYSLEALVSSITLILDKGIDAVGFVSPSHHVPQVKLIIGELEQRGYNPVYVYNSNGYDGVDTLKSLEGIIDVYLPDFKYMDSDIALKYSGAANYPEVAMNAIREMYRQEGSTLVLNNENLAVTGLIIRHLVLPGLSKDSIRILEWIAEELSTSLAISLMSQYFPIQGMERYPELDRCITAEEYEEVTHALELLGFYKGWVQELESRVHYRPDFQKSHPFET